MIKQPLESVSGVGQIQIVGGAARQIQIRLDPDKMLAHGVTVTDVAAALRQQNLELPGGRMNQGAQEVTVRTMGKIADPQAFNAIPVASRGSYVVRISDIGEAVDAAEELRSASFLNGQPALTLVVSKQSGQNTVAVAQTVKARFAQIAASLPPDIKADVLNDQSLFIQAAVRSLEEHLILGSFLAALVIFFFLANLRTTIIAALAIPISIIATFALMRVMGYTLNQITMLALTLMVGVVIDDAIIVLENIYRFIEEKGMRPFDAAIEGTKEIGPAVMATTLSLMAVFVPVGFMGGIVGRFMSSFGLTAAFAVGISLIVSFTLTPMLSSRWIKIKPNKDGGHSHSKESAFFRPIDRAYMAMLRWSMGHRWVIVTVSVLVIASIVPLFAKVGKNFTPSDDRSEFQISVKTAEGSGLAATLTVLERAAAEIRRFPEVTNTLVTVGGTGGGGGFGGGGGTGGVNAGSIYVKLVAPDARPASQDDVIVRARELLRHYPGNLRTSVSAAGGGGGGGIQYSISGPDLGKLGEYSAALLGKMKSLPQLADADTSLVIGKPEFRVEIDRQRAADLGVRVQDIAQALNIMIGGQNVSTFDVGEDQYDVTLRAGEPFRTSLDGLNRLTVFSTRRGAVTLGEFVRVLPSTGPSSIQRLNRERQVTLSANLVPGASQAAVLSQLQLAVDDLHVPAGYSREPPAGRGNWDGRPDIS